MLLNLPAPNQGEESPTLVHSHVLIRKNLDSHILYSVSCPMLFQEENLPSQNIHLAIKEYFHNL